MLGDCCSGDRCPMGSGEEGRMRIVHGPFGCQELC